MLESRSQVFTTIEILQMNKICDKLIKMYIAELAYSKQSDIHSYMYAFGIFILFFTLFLYFSY